MTHYTIVKIAEGSKTLKNGELVQEKNYSDELCAIFDQTAQEWSMFISDDVDYDHEYYGSRHEYSERTVEIAKEEYLIKDDALVGCVINDTAIYFDENKNQTATKTYYCKGISRLESGYGLLTFKLKKKD